MVTVSPTGSGTWAARSERFTPLEAHVRNDVIRVFASLCRGYDEQDLVTSIRLGDPD